MMTDYRALGIYRGIGGLIEDAPHLAIAFRAAVAVVHASKVPRHLYRGTSHQPCAEALPMNANDL